MRIGVIGNEDGWYVNELCRAGAQRHHEMIPLLYQSFEARVTAGRLQLHAADIDLLTMDAILVRTMPPGTLEQVVYRMDLLAGLEALGVRVINSARAIECAVDKHLATQKLALAGLPVPDTAACETTDAALAAFEQFDCDVVVKPLFGAEGRGILRVNDPEMAWRAFRTIERLDAVLYVQKYIECRGVDTRVLVLNGEIVGAMKRTAAAGDFRANAAQHATTVSHTPTFREQELAIQAAEVTGCVFCGVDLIYDVSDSPLIVEVNAVPGWRSLARTCGISVTEKLFSWMEK